MRQIIKKIDNTLLERKIKKTPLFTLDCGGIKNIFFKKSIKNINFLNIKSLKYPLTFNEYKDFQTLLKKIKKEDLPITYISINNVYMCEKKIIKTYMTTKDIIKKLSFYIKSIYLFLRLI